MAEHAVNLMASAVTSELISKVLSGMIQKYGKHAVTSEKLQRLEMLIIKFHSAIEASEMRTIKNSWLLQWSDKLKEAALEGDDVLAIFLQRCKDPQATSNTNANQQQGGAASSSAAAPSVLSFRRNPLSGIMPGIRSARKMLLVSCDDDLERLNKILAKLEKLSLDIGEFIRLLHLDALQNVVKSLSGPAKRIKRRSKKRCSTSSDLSSRPSLFSFSPLTEDKMKGVAHDFYLSRPKEEKMKRVAHEFCLSRPKEEKMKRVAHEFYLPRIDELDELALVVDVECDSSVHRKEEQCTLLQDRLLTAFSAICEAVELAGSRDLEDLQWLAYWTGILREAKQQGFAVLGAISASKSINTEDNGPMVEFDQENNELGGFVNRLECLASDVEHFNKLVYLCRAC